MKKHPVARSVKANINLNAVRMSPDFALTSHLPLIAVYLLAMGKAYTISDQSKPHFITATVVDWIDVFTRKSYKDIVIDNLIFYCQNRGLIVYGYVIMSNHVHLIIQAENNNLSDVLRDFKKFTAKKILEKIQTEPESRREWMLERFKKATETHNRNKNYQFWKYGKSCGRNLFRKIFMFKTGLHPYEPDQIGYSNETARLYILKC